MGLSLLQDEAQHLGQLQARISSSQEPLALMVLQTDWHAFLDPAEIASVQPKLQHLIVLDQLPNNTSRAADVVIPCASIHESEGTLVNHEGRAQRYFAAYEPANLQPAWRSMAYLARWLTAQQPDVCTYGQQALAQCQQFDDISQLVGQLGPVFSRWQEVAPTADFRIAGMKIPRQSHRYSGRTSIYAHINVSERKQPVDQDSALAYTMEGSPVNPAAALIPQVWSPGWNSNEAINKFQAEIDGPLKGGDPGIRLLGDGDWQLLPLTNPPAPDKEALLGVSQSRLFDNEPLSAMASALRQRCPPAMAGMHPDTASQWGLQPGDQVSVGLGDSQWQLAVTLDGAIPPQIILLPAQWHAPIHTSRLPAVVTVKPCPQEAT
jgi:NADH-quinone oxidoreductase subunit G